MARTRKSSHSSASTWRKRDQKHREAERERRRANAKRRQEVAEAAAQGITVEQLRAGVDEA